MREGLKKSEMVVILNKYRDILNDLINSLDLKFLNCSKLVIKRLCNMFRSEDYIEGFL